MPVGVGEFKCSGLGLGAGLAAKVTFEARPLTSTPQSEAGTETGVAAADDHFATTLVQRVVQHDAATGAFVTAERWVAVRAPYGDKYQAKLQWAVWPAGMGGAHLQVCHPANTSFCSRPSLDSYARAGGNRRRNVQPKLSLTHTRTRPAFHRL